MGRFEIIRNPQVAKVKVVSYHVFITAYPTALAVVINCLGKKGTIEPYKKTMVISGKNRDDKLAYLILGLVSGDCTVVMEGDIPVGLDKKVIDLGNGFVVDDYIPF